MVGLGLVLRGGVSSWFVPCGLQHLDPGANTKAMLGQQRLHDLAVDIGEAVVSTLDAKSEALMVNAEQVKHGGVEIVDLDRIFHDII